MDEKDVMQPITRIMQISIIAAILIIIICSIIGYILTGAMINPVVKITNVINKLANMDFTENAIQAKLNKRKDETGEMSRAINTLHTQLISIIKNLKGQSETFFGSRFFK